MRVHSHRVRDLNIFFLKTKMPIFFLMMNRKINDRIIAFPFLAPFRRLLHIITFTKTSVDVNVYYRAMFYNILKF